MKYTTYFISIFLLFCLDHFSILRFVGATPVSLSTDTGFDSQSPPDVADKLCDNIDCASPDKLNIDASRKRDNPVDALEDAIETHPYTQLLDHTNKTKGTFTQRYYVNNNFYKPGGPIFCKY